MADTIDLKIIEKLKINSRISFVELGKHIGLSPSSVRERVQKLEDLEVITGYSIELNSKKLGYGLEVVILFKLYSGKLNLFCDVLQDFPEILEIYRITGAHNIFMKVILTDQLHLQQFIDQLLIYGEPTTHLILSNLKDDKLNGNR
ncbi:Lrp/AsnC family transcriptional regulator, leucine-responsive regulatory protein [Flavobacterium micromati]|jgi:Lrp/AsnC family leucine-responsive transcriptional regulator|uniref:Lrp/AsnC family transcriptional regulator, leucine-responsive regulatory protein n=1 Tax=Flavobacterium micromati TaxID=229205 RepID=A0A1M5J3Z6_9FLAO|nr:Lrp/AsnC family transcriptional regulator [Flavobacterium micromati]MCL6461251.1 Lrp/AsnC family transcriptional regulator [Flavobacterium micromati]SHG35284.1 Lrp/AsnC family transcriptional regulator, leucine-responsive regulatory protein [Flavobacterium micromati]